MEGEFVVVSKKRGRKRKPRTSNVKQTSISTCSNSTSAFDESCYEKSLASIHKCRCEIESSSFWTDVKESWKKLQTASHLKTEEIVCYGAGSISSNPITRYQFAFLVLLAEHLELINHVHIYDPVFTSLERRIVLHFGFNLITKNEECRRSITKTTVVLMMHCGKKMYDNLLQANWSVGLQCMALIGNSFSSYQESRSMHATFSRDRNWDQFHSPRNILLALVGEVGELAELFQWKGEVQEGLPGWSDKERVAVSHELSDVLIYLVRLADRCNIDLSTGVLEKFEINKLKYPVDVVKGCSKKYTEYQIADDAKKSEVQQ